METVFYTILTIACLVFLIKGSEWLMKGAVSLAERANISKLAIATTLIAFGTNLPTLSVSVALMFMAANGADSVVGNALGTSFVNLGLALGIPAFMLTINTKYSVFEKEIPLYLAISAIITSFVYDGKLTLLEGLILILAYALTTYIVYQYAQKEKLSKGNNEELDIDTSTINTVTTENISLAKAFSLVGIGFIVMIVASIVLAYISPDLSRVYGISEYILGLTLIGIGTSLPAIVTSIRAAKKGYIDIILGNVFGGNIANISIGLGLPVLVKTITFNAEAIQDISLLNLFNGLVLALILVEMKLLGNNKILSRASGLLMIIIFFLYIGSKLV